MRTNNQDWTHDLSTIDRTKLAELCPPVKSWVSGDRLQDGEGGNGCAMDPPGYPSYFTRSIYTSRGDSPAKPPYMELLGRALPEDYEDNKQVLKAVYKPLPWGHPRVEAWIADLLRHFQNCYHDPQTGKLVIYPVPSYELRKFIDDPRFSDEWRNKEKAEITQHNVELCASREATATVDNHCAVRAVREIYPAWAPSLGDLTPRNQPYANWYCRYDRPPQPGEFCPGDRAIRAPHREGKWCQFCGMNG